MTRETFSRAEARRICLAAQGFLDAEHHPPTMRTLLRTMERVGVLQIDSVNVLTRAQYMPLFSRMGTYDVDLLRRAAEKRPRRLVEYWAHAAAYMPVELWPYMRHRMARAQTDAWGGPRSIYARRPDLVKSVLEDVARHGPVTARAIDDDLPKTKVNWGWNWSEVKSALEFLFYAGQVTAAGRTVSFERIYDLPERVLPEEVLRSPEPTPAQAHRELIRRAARSAGIATEPYLRDYYRMRAEETRPAIRALVEEGYLIEVSVQGWRQQAYLFRDARVPRRVEAATLLNPFDPLVWERNRTEELFGFRYRIEIYVPEHRREFGYYVLPFLLGDQLVARVDLKADRKAGVLVVKAAHAEPAGPGDTVEQLVGALHRIRSWLGLSGLVVETRGDLSELLRAACGS